MLAELAIRNFALLESVQLALGPGLNVLTGETGAGKSIIIDAIGAVLGGRTSTDVIRTGAERAIVEAIFDLTDLPAIQALLAERALEGDDGTLILSREISRSGRTVARVNGRTVPVSLLAELGALLVDVHGQHEHLSLLRADAQRDLLDRYGGLMAQRQTLAGLVRELRAARAEWRALQQDEREVARRIDLLSFQVEEIRAAKLRPGEEEELARERTLLANAGRLAELAAAVQAALTGGTTSGDEPSAIDLLGRAQRHLAQLVRIDPQLASHEQALLEATAQIEELGRTLRAYAEAIEFSPERLEAVDDRLELIRNLQRKYGATVEEVLAFAEQAAQELDALMNREARSNALLERIATLEQEVAGAALALSRARRAAGDRLAGAVAAELRALSLRGQFEVALLQQRAADGLPLDGERWRYDESGIDEVAFLFAPNPGEPAKPVARTASGGELSRVLLALKAVLSEADRTPTLIFDEVDAGIGGRSGRVLGEKLAELAQRHQVVCVTHLPQIAAYGDQHFFITKQVRDGRTITQVTALDGEARITELAQMLGGVTSSTLQQARELSQRAAAWRHAAAQRGARGTPESETAPLPIEWSVGPSSGAGRAIDGSDHALAERGVVETPARPRVMARAGPVATRRPEQ